MEKNESELAYFAELRDALSAEAVTIIDFDKLSVWLTELGAVLPGLYRAREEAAAMREDYTTRIVGMLKAIAIAEKGMSSLDDALDIIDHLPDKSATELIGYYRKAQARFRDTFPTSFGMITPRRAPFQITIPKHKW